MLPSPRLKNRRWQLPDAAGRDHRNNQEARVAQRVDRLRPERRIESTLAIPEDLLVPAHHRSPVFGIRPWLQSERTPHWAGSDTVRTAFQADPPFQLGTGQRDT